MMVLLVTRDALKRLCGVVVGDVSEDADWDALILEGEPVLEYALDPEVLAASAGDDGLRATLTLGVSEALAGEWLRRRASEPGAADDFQVGPLSVTASRTDGPAQVGARLAAQGMRRLGPFVRASDGTGQRPLLLASVGDWRGGKEARDDCFGE